MRLLDYQMEGEGEQLAEKELFNVASFIKHAFKEMQSVFSRKPEVLWRSFQELQSFLDTK